MKKITLLLIILFTTIIFAVVSWYFFIRDKEVPLADTIQDVLPFGSGDDIQTPTDNNEPLTETTDQPIADEVQPPTVNLFRISETPVAGAVVLNKNSSTTVARYVDRATGHIYDINLATLEKTKITNQTIPKVYEAHFKKDGSAVLLRTLDDDSDVIENISISLTPPSKQLSTSSPEIDSTLYRASSTAIRGDIGSIATDLDSTLYYVVKDTNSIVASSFNGTGVKTLFSSAFTDWRIVNNGTNLFLYTKASSDVPGYAYTLKASGGTLTKVLGPLNGLVALPNSKGNKVIYSYVDENGTTLFVKNLTNGSVSQISAVTLAEKCVWSLKKVGVVLCGSPSDEPSVDEPDHWYRGVTSFNDRIWSFDTDTDVAKLLVEPTTLGFDIDVAEPKLSPNEDYLVFINKKDLNLWALNLE